MTTDSEKLLTEKLEVTRELSTLKPELEHLRAQVASNTSLLTDKLSLQRQLSELQVQLEHAKSDAKRAQAKRRNTAFEVDQEETISHLQKALTREKRLREKAQEALETAQADLEHERSNGQRKMAKDVERAEGDAALEVQLEEARRELQSQKKERDRAERSLTKSQQEWDATKALLDDKLNQFRSKLKSTKERLNQAEVELAQAQEAAVNPTASAVTKHSNKSAATDTKPVKKRKAGAIDPDSQKLGTPGPDKPAKRGRTKPSAIGDKSTFSLTPFMNRTMSIAPESPPGGKKAADAPEVESEQSAAEDGDEGEEDVNGSPAAAKAKSTTKSKKEPLSTVPASKSNIKKDSVPRTKKASKQTEALEKVVEEEEPASQPKQKTAKAKAKESTTVSKVPLKGSEDDQGLAEKPAEDGKAPIEKPQKKQKQKTRKSLATFTSFMLAPEPEATTKQKKRKLGGLGKTLFDEDDDALPKPLAGRNAMFGGARASGPFGALKGGSLLAGARPGPGGLLAAKRKGGMLEEGGFMFSPLKRNRGGADSTFLK